MSAKGKHSQPGSDQNSRRPQVSLTAEPSPWLKLESSPYKLASCSFSPVIMS